MLCYTIMIVEVKSHEYLTDFLRRSGLELSTACFLHKGCGKCKVKLLSGIWESEGKLLPSPGTAIACVTRLKSCIGTIEIPDAKPAVPQVLQDWQSPLPLPTCPEPVIAIDMGSTTLAAVRIEKGEIVKKASTFNGQISFGDNVISRIAQGKENFNAVRNALLDSVQMLLEQLESSSVKRIGAAGNTVMNCFLHGIAPDSIGVYPFKAPQLFFPERDDIFPPLPLVTVPSLTGLLGGDITSALYEAPLEEGELLLDLGTNCEIIFRTSAGYVGTSAAAGPAFEGAGITSGCRAVPGAIDHYRKRNEFSVIGGLSPRGLCGSALVDFLAVERESGALSSYGRFVSGESFVEIVPGVTVSESDIAELLKAKAAVASAVKALELFTSEKVKKIKLAGGFSQYLDLNSARRIGLLPPLPTKIAGNLSLGGAARAALLPDTVEEMKQYAEKIREIHLNEIPGFERLFTESLLIP